MKLNKLLNENEITCYFPYTELSLITRNLQYNIPPGACDTTANLTEMTTIGTDVLSVGVTYNFFGNQNRVTLKTLWKSDSHCTGNYSMQTCALDLADVSYPVLINANVKEATATGLHDTTIMTLDADLLTQPLLVKDQPPPPELYGGYNYAVPGLAGLFGQILNSTVHLQYNDNNLAGSGGCNNILASGLFGQQQLATTGISFSTASDVCEGKFGNITTAALASIQSMMFQLGAYNFLSYYGDPSHDASDTEANTPRLLAAQSYTRNEYKIVWAWYFGAMAVTTLVAAFILPTFWGYWRLERKTTMSPFETARAFHAPVLYQEDASVRSEELIKRVGGVRIHRDLPVVNVPGARPGRTW